MSDGISKKLLEQVFLEGLQGGQRLVPSGEIKAMAGVHGAGKLMTKGLQGAEI